jgi:hypothetical protein
LGLVRETRREERFVVFYIYRYIDIRFLERD